METKMLQIKVVKSNIIASHATKWLVAFIGREPDFFLQMIEAMDALKTEDSKNELVPFMLGVVNNMKTGKDITSNEIIAFSWLVRDAWETREEFKRVNGDGEDLFNKVAEMKKQNPGMTTDQILHKMMDKVKGDVFFEKPKSDTEEVKDELEKKGFIKSNFMFKQE